MNRVSGGTHGGETAFLGFIMTIPKTPYEGHAELSDSFGRLILQTSPKWRSTRFVKNVSKPSPFVRYADPSHRSMLPSLRGLLMLREGGGALPVLPLEIRRWCVE